MVNLSSIGAEHDHVHWCDDYATWMRDVEGWQARDDDTLAELRRLYAYVIALKSAARGHAEAITKYADVCHRHVGALACDAGRREHGAMAFVHDQMAARHAHTKADHEQIKEHHRSVGLRLRELVESVAVRAKEGVTWTTIE